MRKKIRGIVQVLMCRLNRHEYVMRATFEKGRGLKACMHCGKSEVAG